MNNFWNKKKIFRVFGCKKIFHYFFSNFLLNSLIFHYFHYPLATLSFDKGRCFHPGHTPFPPKNISHLLLKTTGPFWLASAHSRRRPPRFSLLLDDLGSSLSIVKLINDYKTRYKITHGFRNDLRRILIRKRISTSSKYRHIWHYFDKDYSSLRTYLFAFRNWYRCNMIVDN